MLVSLTLPGEAGTVKEEHERKEYVQDDGKIGTIGIWVCVAEAFFATLLMGDS